MKQNKKYHRFGLQWVAARFKVKTNLAVITKCLLLIVSHTKTGKLANIIYPSTSFFNMGVNMPPPSLKRKMIKLNKFSQFLYKRSYNHSQEANTAVIKMLQIRNTISRWKENDFTAQKLKYFYNIQFISFNAKF